MKKETYIINKRPKSAGYNTVQRNRAEHDNTEFTV